MTRTILVCAAAAGVAGSVLLTAAATTDSWPSPASPLPARRPPDVSTLADGQTIERRLVRGDDHRYRLQVNAGECVRVIVEQRGIDLIVQTRDPSGHPIADFDAENRYRGEEQVDVVAGATGTYTVAISASPVTLMTGAYAIRVARRFPATAGDRSMQESRRLQTEAAQLTARGAFGEASSRLERALSLTESVRGPEDSAVALLLFDLAENTLGMRDDSRSRPLVERAIAILDHAWGADHPFTARARALMALVDFHAGQGPRSESMLRQSLEIYERTLGVDHRWYAQALITQANARFNAGDFEAAEAADRRAMAILERIQDTEGIPYTALLNNFGELSRQKGDRAQAENLFQRSLVAAERLEGPESYRASTSLQNLGIIAREQKNYAKALAYDLRALSMRERILGSDHTDIAPLLNNLAIVHHLMGDDARALAVHFRALDIWEKTVGPYHRGTLNSVGNIARLYASMGDTANAIAFDRRAAAILDKQLALNLAVGSERQKLAFVQSVSERTDRTISLHLDRARRDPDAASLAALVLLQRKGRVQDAMADVFSAVRDHLIGAADRELMDRLNDTTSSLAHLTLNPPDGMAPEQRRQTLAGLEARKEQLEATLSEHSAEFRAETRPVTVEAVQAAIPEDAALIEFAVFRPFHPEAEQNSEAYGPPHYAAYIVRRDAPPAGVDLGDKAAIDRSIAALREALRDPTNSGVTWRARILDEQVMRPFDALLANARRLIISPDGQLNLVPFEALVDGGGRFRIERYAVSYLTSGRDLLRMQVPRTSHAGAVIVADPLFGEPTDSSSGPQLERAPTASVTTGAALSSVYFAPLAATRTEARSINQLFPDATLLIGAGATKARLQQVSAPRILHIASHGFFLDNDAPAAADRNPLLRSGLAFAGANLARDRRADGILTALEASGLDLWGTQLVTLSACDTGIGEVRNGEGVYGLRRAFVLAGAETLVMSLWPVSDYIARDTMVAYYTGLRAGGGRGDALRQAKLAMLRRPGRRHPYYWAGFIQSGEWAALSGRR